jgi:hypothetical protein
MLRRNPENKQQAIEIINEMRNPEHYMFHIVEPVVVDKINRMALQTLLIVRNNV